MTRGARSSLSFIVGPTACGKTDAAIALALALRSRGRAAEIVNADSRQVYRGMSIGTAKPSTEQLVAVPHHLIDVADPVEGFSLARFLTLARSAIADIVLRGSTAIVVGGTGQYVWGLADGWDVPAVPARLELRGRLEAEASSLGGEAMFERLRSLDPAAASFIDARNIRRVIRALEVIEATGMPFSRQRRKTPPPFDATLFGISVRRDELHARIDRRVDAMFAAGFVDEVRDLLAAGCSPDLPSFSSVGYREVASYLNGEIALEEAKRRMRTGTHRLARSQANWFGVGDPRISWFATREDLVATVVAAVAA